MYVLESFGRMFADPVRRGAFVAALRATVRPGDVVLDVGTGVGVFAILAARLGAGRVIGIDTNPVVRLGPELATANGVGDRVEFQLGSSLEFTMPEPADVVIGDLRGSTPFNGRSVEVMRDAARRHLRPGGSLLGRRDRVFAAPVECGELLAKVFDPWDAGDLGLEFGATRRLLANTLLSYRVDTEALLAHPVPIHEVDYLDGDELGMDVRVEVPIRQPGSVDGIAVWFEADIASGITISTAPDAPESVYGMAVLPIADRRRVVAGSTLEFAVSATPDGGGYRWSWEVRGVDVAGEPWQCRQDTLNGQPFDVDLLRRRSIGHRIEASDPLRADAFALAALGRGETLGDISQALVSSYPDLFDQQRVALGHVADMAARYDGPAGNVRR